MSNMVNLVSIKKNKNDEQQKMQHILNIDNEKKINSMKWLNNLKNYKIKIKMMHK